MEYLDSYSSTGSSGSSGTRREYCPQCRRGFKDQHALEQHLNSPAHNAKQFKCPFCGLSTNTAAGVAQHVEGGMCPRSPVSRKNIPDYVRSIETRLGFQNLLTTPPRITYLPSTGSYAPSSPPLSPILPPTLPTYSPSTGGYPPSNHTHPSIPPTYSPSTGGYPPSNHSPSSTPPLTHSPRTGGYPPSNHPPTPPLSYNASTRSYTPSNHSHSSTPSSASLEANVRTMLRDAFLELKETMDRLDDQSRSWNGRAFACYLCSREFKSTTSLQQHLASPAHEAKDFWCRTCRKQFNVISALVQHVESETCSALSVGRALTTNSNYIGAGRALQYFGSAPRALPAPYSGIDEQGDLYTIYPPSEPAPPTMSEPLYPTTSEPFYPTTSEPFYPTTSEPFYPTTSEPYYPTTSEPYYPTTSEPFYPTASEPYYAATSEPYYATTNEPFYPVTSELVYEYEAPDGSHYFETRGIGNQYYTNPQGQVFVRASYGAPYTYMYSDSDSD
ncbi:hypothetical protein BC938DRAFT_476917 [Jimgerdemannia flammicorona]|uniref:C2H2-type domain-containing protein n=1 Tax=Jimgerdemannia flammicorona TaxID=994334 RepID=A0A433PD88_9FUNG|nr:hypothetical protein BC938DRAFT_476917 [Jimgerdemannia flammicorona]